MTGVRALLAVWLVGVPVAIVIGRTTGRPTSGTGMSTPWGAHPFGW